MDTIGKRIKAKRLEKGWTQEDLAKKMGYKSKSTINKIEKDINDIVQSNVVKFAEVLGTTTSWLMGWDPEQIDTAQEVLNDIYASIDEEETHVLIEKVKRSDEQEKKLISYVLSLDKKQKDNIESYLEFLKNDKED